ncbi:Mur ligase family protein [Halobium salinum]|uniref:Mur ligase family protein n=1 Tax=Halobium salinum TaxID=1364940 RepID=A0ABD5PG94_9EURY|nr:Mur ligase family protein [Halobium salinum]
MNLTSLPDSLEKPLDSLKKFAAVTRRGTAHEAFLNDIDATVVVSGTRGKSGLTRRVSETLTDRGRDALGKVTGNHPKMLYGGEEYPIERGDRVTLYENADEVQRFEGADTLVLENQAIGEYTTRLVNGRFTDPDVVVLTNVRRDHIDRLGSNRMEIARSFARSIPDGAHVVNGEQTPEIRSYFEETFADRDVTLTHVSVPEEHRAVPGAETIHAIDEVLDALGEPPLARERLLSYLDEMHVEWTDLAGGRVFDAASVNDVDSTEAIREALCQGRVDVVQPFLYLRGDRRARTNSFLNYLTGLYREGKIERAYVAGETTDLFASRAPFPVTVADDDPETALGDALADGWPVLVMGNTVADYMRELAADIDRRESESAVRDRLDATVVGSDELPNAAATSRTEPETTINTPTNDD